MLAICGTGAIQSTWQTIQFSADPVNNGHSKLHRHTQLDLVDEFDNSLHLRCILLMMLVVYTNKGIICLFFGANE